MNALIVDLSREAPVIVRPLAQPDRLVIELQGVVFVAGAPAPVKAGGLVRAYRYGLVLGERSRIVLDLAEPAIVQHIDFVPIDGVMRLVLQLRKVERAAFAEAVARMQVAEVAGLDEGARLPPVKADSRPLVLLDPGHGGIDPGAIGTTGVAEKDIVLSVARKIRDRALADGTVQVVLTREDDVFLPLSERVRIGRKLQPAFMLSLHADKIVAEPRLRGASIYTLSEKASDAAAARAAENENKADLQAGGQVPETQPEGIGDILYDLARRETRHASVGMARHIIGAMGEATPVLGRPLRAAGFHVLTAPDVPAALLELGYLSNPEDVKQLTTPEWQEAIAQRIVAALVERLAGKAGDRASTGAIRPAP